MRGKRLRPITANSIKRIGERQIERGSWIHYFAFWLRNIYNWVTDEMFIIDNNIFFSGKFDLFNYFAKSYFFGVGHTFLSFGKLFGSHFLILISTSNTMVQWRHLYFM